MIRNIYLASLLFLCACKSPDTISNESVIVDFTNPTYPSTIILEPRQTLEIKLVNVNPYLYEIGIKDSLIVYQTEQPALFGQIFTLPQLNTVPKEAPPSNPSVGGALAKDNPTGKIAEEEKSAIDADFKKFVAGYSGKESVISSILKLSKIADDINKLLTDCYSTAGQLKSMADIYIIEKLSLSSETLPIGIQSEISNRSASARGDIEQYIGQGEILKKSYSAILDGVDKTMPLSQYKIIEKDIKDKISIIDKILENCKKLLDKLTAFDDSKVGIAIEDNYKKVMTSRIQKTLFRTTHYSTDEVAMNIEIRKKRDVYCLNDMSGFPITAIVKGGLKIDFSTGVVFNIGQKCFFNQSYHYDSLYRDNTTTLADSVMISRNRNNNIVIPSLGAFFHVYSRRLSSLNFGGMVGASLGADQRTYIHTGACALFGKSQRLIVGIGASVASAKILDGQFSENQIFKRSLAPTEIPKEDASRVGFYIGISWNLNLIR